MLPLLVVFVLVCAPFVLLWIFGFFLLRVVVLFIVWTFWSPRGISMLVIYSNSPHWQDYFEKGLLPLVGRHSKVMNWSERSTWRLSLSKILFALFGGEREYNPMIILFTPFHWPTTLRFHQPFRDARHGKAEPLTNLEQKLTDWLNKPINLKKFHPRKSA